MTTEENIVLESDVSKSTGAIDRALSKLTSRKLLVWTTATVALFMNIVPPQEWLQVCLLYIGSQAAVDMIVAYRNSGR
jgi:hypothetical protein